MSERPQIEPYSSLDGNEVSVQILLGMYEGPEPMLLGAALPMPEKAPNKIYFSLTIYFVLDSIDFSLARNLQ